VSISSTLNVQIFRSNVVLAVFSSYMYIEKAAKMTFVRKMRAYNVDEIDGMTLKKQSEYSVRPLIESRIIA